MNQTKNTDTPKDTSNRKMTSKQLVAIIGIVLLVLMYVVTLIVAFVDNSSSGSLFGMCLIATFVIPLMIWVYTWMYGKLTGKTTIADLNLGGKDHVTDEEVREILIKQATGDTDNPEK